MNGLGFFVPSTGGPDSSPDKAASAPDVMRKGVENAPMNAHAKLSTKKPTAPAPFVPVGEALARALRQLANDLERKP